MSNETAGTRGGNPVNHGREDVKPQGSSAGSMRGLYLVVPDIEASRRESLDRGVSVSEIRHKDTEGGWRGGFRPGLDPGRADYGSFADFRDPDGNAWALQERGHR
jgi:catechol 2,3-dioxygenase-like lactoylglutathione lyase family enzyme